MLGGEAVVGGDHDGAEFGRHPVAPRIHHVLAPQHEASAMDFQNARPGGLGVLLRAVDAHRDIRVAFGARDQAIFPEHIVPGSRRVAEREALGTHCLDLRRRREFGEVGQERNDVSQIRVVVAFGHGFSLGWVFWSGEG